MSRNFASSSDHLDASALATAQPCTIGLWFNTTSSQGRRLFTLGSSTDVTQLFALVLDVTSNTGLLGAYKQSGSSNVVQALTSAAIAASTWQHGIAVWASASAIAVYLNGGNKGSSSFNFAPTGINKTVISGRLNDHLFGIGGGGAHAFFYARALSDLEATYLGSGGNPQSLSGLADYYKIVAGTSPESDLVGTTDLTVTGAASAAGSEPAVESFLVGSAIGAQSYTAGSAISSIDLSTSASPLRFDTVSSAYTVALKQLATPTQPTTTSSGLTAVREIPVVDASAFSAGDYMKITSGGTPTRVLAADATSDHILVANNQTYSSGANVYRFAVNPLTVAGMAITSNVWAGTPSAAQTLALCLFRATCNGNSALKADSDLFTMTIASGGGGGGGGGLQLPAGAFAGGFVGG